MSQARPNITTFPPIDQDAVTSRWLSIRESARYIRATNWFVEELCRSHQIPYKRNGKKFVLDRQDLDRFMEAGKVTAETSKARHTFASAFEQAAA